MHYVRYKKRQIQFFRQQMMYNLKKINGMNQKDGEIQYKKELLKNNYKKL